MDNFEIMRVQLSNNLKLLSTQEFIKRRKEDVKINPETFRRLTPKAFQLITYHLFNKLNAEECSKRFIGCFPVLDRRQEGEFRQTTNKWLQEIAAKETTYQFPRVVPIYFQHFTPESIVCKLYLEFTNFILFKESKKISSGAQQLNSSNHLLNEEVIEQNFDEYQITMANINDQKQEWTQNMGYFIESDHKVGASIDQLLQKKIQLLDGVRQKYELSHESDCNQFLDNHSKQLEISFDSLKTDLKHMNQLMAKNWNNYLVAFESDDNSSNDLPIDLNKWFGRNQLDSFSCAAQEFIRRVKHFDSVLQNVSDKSLINFSNNSSDYLNELQTYRKHLKEMVSDYHSMLDQFKELTNSRRAQLLATPEIIERRKWFEERIPNISKLKFKIQPKPRITKEVEALSKTCFTGPVPKETNEKSDESQVFTSRPSISDFSFQVMDISAYHYVPPSGSPILMNDSHLFSPIENKTKLCFDSK